jgi:hypothetical protein
VISSLENSAPNTGDLPLSTPLPLPLPVSPFTLVVEAPAPLPVPAPNVKMFGLVNQNSSTFTAPDKWNIVPATANAVAESSSEVVNRTMEMGRTRKK